MLTNLRSALCSTSSEATVMKMMNIVVPMGIRKVKTTIAAMIRLVGKMKTKAVQMVNTILCSSY